jgi:hypothetical protein
MSHFRPRQQKLYINPNFKWVRTELGGSAADLSVEEGAVATLEKIIAARKEDSGAFMNVRVKGWENPTEGKNLYDGVNYPW